MSESFEYKHDVLSVVSESDNFASAVCLSGNGHDVDESWVVEYMCELSSKHGFSDGIVSICGNGSDVWRKSEVFRV